MSKQSINRQKVNIAIGATVTYEKELYRIAHILSMSEVIGIHIQKGTPAKLNTSKVSAPIEASMEVAHQKDLDLIDSDEWRSVETRLYGIAPILEGKSLEEIYLRANEIGVSFTTLYRWFRGYQNYGGVAGLLPKKRGRKLGDKKIDVRAEIVISKVLESFYLSMQRPNVQAVINKIHAECYKMNIPLPSKNTIRNRIAEIDDRTKLGARHDRQLAKDKFDPAPKKFEVPYPLHTVQIDHTRMDIVIVSENDRQPIGRPWLTLAIDIYSRMIHGYYLSLEAPSATSVAMCIATGIVPKDKLLADLKIDTDWNIWGFMDNVHVDNGADFRSETLMKACMLHGINIDYRPLGKTNYGGHIERMIGTAMSEMHLVAGTTFSSVKDKGKYNPEENATMTFRELEKWLVSFITTIYHKRTHNGIGMSPEEKFMDGILHGDAIGLPAKPNDADSIYRDFLPSFQRTIQRNGVNIDGLNYYDSVLKRYIHAKDPKSGKKREYFFKRDPKNIAEVWFYNEDDQCYYRIPLADQSVEHLTLHELNLLKQIAKDKRDSTRRVSDRDILMAYEGLHDHVEASKKETKKARRSQERTKVAREQYEQVLPKKRPSINSATEDNDLWDNLDDIPDFDTN